MKKQSEFAEPAPQGRLLARVLAEDLTTVVGGELNRETKSVSCGGGCDEVVTDCLKLPDDSFNE